MGLIFDTSELIAAERRREPIADFLDRVLTEHGDTDFAIAAMTVLELDRGLQWATTPAVRNFRKSFIDDVFRSVRVLSFDESVAHFAAKVEVQVRESKQSIALAGLLIASTALQHGCDLATLNRKHFEAVPGLRVISL